jgi:GntR family transcriptional regulator
MINLVLDKTSPIPLYFQIEEWLRGQIAGGQLKPGDMLPNEISLSEGFGVSRMTVRQALNHLTAEGLLTRQRAKGTFVAPPRSQVSLMRDRIRSVTEEAAEQGRRLTSRVLAQELVSAPAEVAAAFNWSAASQLGAASQLDPSEPFILIRRLRSIDEGPLCIETVYHPYRRFPDLLTMDLVDRSIYSILEEQYHSRPAEAVDTFTAGIAAPEEADLLEIEAGAPVMRYQRTSWDAAGAPVEFTIAIYRADRYQFVIRYQG